MSVAAPRLVDASAAATRPVGGHLGGRPGRPVRWPWALPVGAAATAWVAYGALAGAGDTGHAHHALLAGAMAVAMMGPFAVPVCTVVARATEWRRSRRAIAVAFASFATVWVAAGVALHVGVEAVAPAVPGQAVVAALGVWSAFDAGSHRRGRRLDACVVSRPILPGARALGASALATGAAWRCVRTCWAPMALTVVDPRPPVVAAVSVTILAERVVTPRPRLAVAAAFVVLAAVATWTLP